jgi:hypothetical protein
MLGWQTVTKNCDGIVHIYIKPKFNNLGSVTQKSLLFSLRGKNNSWMKET